MSEDREHSKTPLVDLIDDMVADSKDGTLTLGAILDDLGDRSYGPLFFSLGSLILLPIGAIPGVPIVIGAILIILAVQFIFGLHHPWMPTRFRRLSVSEEKIKDARRRIMPVLRFADRFLDARLFWIVSKPMRVFAAVSIVFLSLAMAPLEIVPFGVVPPGVAVAAFGLAIIARDGLLMLTALGFVGATVYLLLGLLSFFQ